MFSRKNGALSTALLASCLYMGGCMMMPTGGMTEEEKEIRSDLSATNYMPAPRTMRDNIETQDLFAQAAFWSREYDLNPSDLEATIKLASAVRKMGNPQRAVEITQTGRSLYPRDPYLGAELAAALVASERAGEALPLLDEMLAIAPGYARLWSLKGAALDQSEKYELARKYYARALQITPHDPNILTNIGLSYALAGDPATAEGWLRRAAAAPGASEAVQQNLDLVLQLQGKPTESDKANALPSLPAANMGAPNSVPYPPQASYAPPPRAPQPAFPHGQTQMQTQPQMQKQSLQGGGNILDKIARNVGTTSQAPAPRRAQAAPQAYPQQPNYAPQGYPQAYQSQQAQAPQLRQQQSVPNNRDRRRR